MTVRTNESKGYFGLPESPSPSPFFVAYLFQHFIWHILFIFLCYNLFIFMCHILFTTLDTETVQSSGIFPLGCRVDKKDNPHCFTSNITKLVRPTNMDEFPEKLQGVISDPKMIVLFSEYSEILEIKQR